MAYRHIIRKDLIVLTRDRRAVMVLVVMPLVFIAILGFSTGKLIGWQNENNRLHLVLVAPEEDAIIAEIAASLRRRDGIALTSTARAEDAYTLVDDGNCVAAVTVGPSFRRRVDALTIGDVLDPNQGRLADGLAGLDMRIYARPTQAAAAALADQLVLAETVKVLLPHLARRHALFRVYLEANDRSRAASATTQPVNADNATRTVDYGSAVYQIIVPSYTVMFAFFLVNIMARSFIRERDEGTLIRLRAAPVSTVSLLLGKTTPFFIVSVVQCALLFVFGKLLFGMSWGEHPWLLPLVIVCTSLAATALGLLTSLFVRTEAQVSAYANLLVITLAGLSGCFMPRAWLPETMRQVSLAIPHAWALIAFDQTLNSAHPNLARILTCCGVLVLFSAAFFVWGGTRFRRLVER